MGMAVPLILQPWTFNRLHARVGRTCDELRHIGTG